AARGDAACRPLGRGAGADPRSGADLARPSGRLPLPVALPASDRQVRRAAAPPSARRRARAWRALLGPRTVSAIATNAPLLEVRGLTKTFKERRGWPIPKTVAVRALDAVSFDVARGEALGIVGESGCGKSTVARACLRLISADAGSVRFDGIDVAAATPAALRALRRRLQIVFQDPASALDPRQRISDALGESIKVHGIARGAAVTSAVARLLDEG